MMAIRFLLWRITAWIVNIIMMIGTITWEECGLRIWLNDIFYNMAFNLNEQNAIAESTVINNNVQNDINHTTGGMIQKI